MDPSLREYVFSIIGSLLGFILGMSISFLVLPLIVPDGPGLKRYVVGMFAGLIMTVGCLKLGSWGGKVFATLD